MIKVKASVLATICIGIVGCGGGSTDNSSERSGVFLDSPVANMEYRTETISGTTNSQGSYEYIAGESVVFSIGDLEFPRVSARSVVTPLDIAGTSDVNDSRVVNMSRLLQTLDVDGNADNGIYIPDSARSVATPVDFDLPESEFSNSGAVTSLIFNAGQDTAVTALVSSENAIDHLQEQLNADSFLTALDKTYLFNGTEMIITAPGINSDRGGNLQFNLKNNNVNPRHMVQVTTVFSTKQEFDNAFVNNTLVLAGDNVQSIGMEFDGRFNASSQSSFIVTVTANENGTYDFVSRGTMNIPTYTCPPNQPCSSNESTPNGTTTVSRVVVRNIQYGDR